MSTKYSIAGYCRISVDEEMDRDNTSIENQKAIITDFVKRKFPDSTLEFYEDRDRSGYTFEQREGYQELRKKMLRMEYDILIVKDFSRFSRRNSKGLVELEDLRDAGMRIISIGDNIDYPTYDDWTAIQFRFLINEMPVTDTSKKVKSVIKRRQEEGKWICAVPYGYVMTNSKTMKFDVDEPAAQVVKRIFRLASEGVGYNKMAKIFREEKVLTPIAYFNLNNPDYFKSDYWRKEFDWHVTSIRAILNNEVYLGKLVYGKQRNKSMKSKEKVRNPKEDWIVVENCHEPIITQELWDTVHKILNAKHRPAKAGEVQMFAGLLYCSDCGHCLTYSQKQRKDGSYHGAYSCWMYKTHGKEYCASHYITFDTIYELVLIDIQRNLFQYRKNTDKFKSILSRKYQSDSQKQAEQITLEYEQKQKRCEELDKIISRLYEDNVLGRIGDERYESMSQSYELEQVEIKKALPILKSKIDELKRQSDCADNFINVIKKYTIIDKLDAAILNELIDKIVVHHKEQAEDGRTFQQIEIYYRFVGKLGTENELSKAA